MSLPSPSEIKTCCALLRTWLSPPPILPSQPTPPSSSSFSEQSVEQKNLRSICWSKKNFSFSAWAQKNEHLLAFLTFSYPAHSSLQIQHFTSHTHTQTTKCYFWCPLLRTLESNRTYQHSKITSTLFTFITSACTSSLFVFFISL